MTHTETNKLHDALKNDELMKEVGRLATEEQKKIIETNKPVEEWEKEFDDEFSSYGIVGDRKFKEYLPHTYNSIKDFIRETREQRAREVIEKITPMLSPGQIKYLDDFLSE